MEPGQQFIKCKSCGRKYAWKPSMAGRTYVCKCGAKVAMPLQMEDALPAATPPIAPPVVKIIDEPPPLPPRMPLVLSYNSPTASESNSTFKVLGVICLIASGIALMANLLVAVVFFFIASNAPRSKAPPPPLSAEVVPAYSGEWLGSGGYPVAQRSQLLSKVQNWPQLANFTADRAAMLDLFLADAGQRLFTNADTPIVSMTQSPTGPDGGSTFGTHVLTTSGGRLEIDNSSAKFFPADGSPDCKVVGNCFVDVDGKPQWSSVPVTLEVNSLSRSIDGISAPQATAIGRWMTEKPRLPNPDDWQFAGLEPVKVESKNQSLLKASLDGKSKYILPDGRAGDADIYPDGIYPDGTPVLPPPVAPPTGDPRCVLALAVEAIAAAFVWSMMITGSLRTFLHPKPGAIRPGRLLELSAILKIACTVIWVILQMVLLSTMPPSTPAGRLIFTPVQLFVIGTIVQLIVPSLVLGLLRLPSVTARLFATDDSLISRDVIARQKFAIAAGNIKRSPLMLAITVVIIVAGIGLLVESFFAVKHDPGATDYAGLICGIAALAWCGQNIFQTVRHVRRKNVAVVAMIAVLLSAGSLCRADVATAVNKIVGSDNTLAIRSDVTAILDAERLQRFDPKPVEDLMQRNAVAVLYRSLTALVYTRNEQVECMNAAWVKTPPRLTVDQRSAAIAAIPIFPSYSDWGDPYLNIITVLGDDPAVRLAVCRYLDYSCKDHALNWLIKVDPRGETITGLVKDRLASGKSAPIWALGAIGSPGVAPLENLAGNSNPMIAVAALKAMGSESGSPEVIPFLLNAAITARRDDYQRQAVISLLNLKPDGVHAVVNGLFDGKITNRSWSEVGWKFPHVSALIGLLSRQQKLNPADAEQRKAVLYMIDAPEPRDALLAAMSSDDEQLVKLLASDFDSGAPGHRHRSQIGPVLLHRLDVIMPRDRIGQPQERYPSWIDPTEMTAPKFAPVNVSSINNGMPRTNLALILWCWILIGGAAAIGFGWTMILGTIRSME